MSHWSSGLTDFPPQGAAIWTLKMQTTLWNWDNLLALSCYSMQILKKKSFLLLLWMIMYQFNSSAWTKILYYPADNTLKGLSHQFRFARKLYSSICLVWDMWRWTMKKILSPPLISTGPLEFLSNPLQTLTIYLFYWMAASVATIRSPIASVQSLIYTPGSLTNKNLCFTLLTN